MLPPAVAGVFECMRVAELAILEAKRRQPDRACELDAAFILLRPTEPIRGKAPEVYRSHVVELLERVVAGDDTRPGTKAEALCALLGAATRAPLNAAGCLLADRLSFAVLGYSAPGDPPHEPWPGAADELLRGARNATRVEGRRARAP